jgi:hypothetical protein
MSPFCRPEWGKEVGRIGVKLVSDKPCMERRVGVRSTSVVFGVDSYVYDDENSLNGLWFGG